VTSDDKPKRTVASASDEMERLLLEQVQQIVMELHRRRASPLQVHLDSELDRELGLDSLGRVELISRLERAFDLQLSEQVLSTAATPRDLLQALRGATMSRFIPAALPRSPLRQASTTVTIPVDSKTLTEVLEWHVAMHPERPHVHLHGDSDRVDVITYAALHQKALKIAAGLQSVGIKSRQTVAIMLPTSADFLACFYGTLFAGGIPVPIYPPSRPAQLQDHLTRQVGILNNAQSVFLITIPEARRLAYLVKALVPDLQHVVTPSDLLEDKGSYIQPIIQSTDTAFIQYTSGSTGTPKGVVLTHANLLANIRAMNRVVNTTPSDVFVSWLPLYHDMGLIGAWLGSVYCAYQLVLMSPLTFLSRPARWLWAIHQYGGSISGAPNFAYGLCLNKIDLADLEGLDLSSWRLAFNGAEAINAHTMLAFIERFAPYGFRSGVMLPVYGLAEGSLGVAFPPLGRVPRIDHVQRESLSRWGQAIPVDNVTADTVSFVSCGLPLPGHQIRVIDDFGVEAPERQVGKLEFRGPSATHGYFRNAEATSELFDDDWLVSGDLAYMADGEVFITGRLKDIIIRAGRNLYPHELEDAVGNVEGIRKGCVAVFGSMASEVGTEQLIVVAETRETEAERWDTIRSQISRVAVDVLGAPPDDIVLVPPASVLKTSSGKIRRSAMRDLYEGGKIGVGQGPVWLQIVHMALSAWWPQMQRLQRNLLRIIFAGYIWSVFGFLTPLAWLAAILIPSRTWRQTIIQKLARLAFRFSGIPIQAQGLEHLPDHAAYVLVVNHASYLDALLLIAVLPPGLKYVAKLELSRNIFSRLPMQRLGVEFVERFEATRGAEDTERIVQIVRQGEPVLFFPEGTFYRDSGLQPFRMGAFVVAAQAGVPVIPAAIR
jgi:acyl carrier protein